MVKIAFYSDGLDVRGTCTAMYDYAHYNEILLKNESIIITQKNQLRKKNNNNISKKMLN